MSSIIESLVESKKVKNKFIGDGKIGEVKVFYCG